MDLRADPKSLHEARDAVQYVQQRVPEQLSAPRLAIICGSGLGGLADLVDPESQVMIAYKDIPHFPQSTVYGHASKLLFGHLGSTKQAVALMLGRAHFYEGHSISDITFPIRVLKLLGVSHLLVTNAAGGLNPSYAVGDLMILSDVRDLLKVLRCRF